jgi:hypothetical protein
MSTELCACPHFVPKILAVIGRAFDTLAKILIVYGVISILSILLLMALHPLFN